MVCVSVHRADSIHWPLSNLIRFSWSCAPDPDSVSRRSAGAKAETEERRIPRLVPRSNRCQGPSDYDYCFFHYLILFNDIFFHLIVFLK